MSAPGGLARAWRRPAQLALLTLVGLVSALMGTGPWHWLAWLCLAIPIVAAARAVLAAAR